MYRLYEVLLYDITTVGKLFLTNPIGLAATAIAAGAYLIYDNWSSISNFFIDIWSGVSTTFNNAWGGGIKSSFNGVVD